MIFVGWIFALLAPIAPQEAESPARSPSPKLVLLVSVDQMRPDYLERFRPHLKGGFLKLLEEGVLFADCQFEHAATETGPGHATLSTGRNPRSHGIVANAWFDRSWRREYYCIEDFDSKPVGGGSGGSPKNLKTDALGDWIREKFPQSKVVSVSGKDRSAILMAGQKPTLVLWYAKEIAGFATGSYYRERLPEWFPKWEKANGGLRYKLKKWDRLLSSEKLRECGASEDRQKGEFLHGFGKYWFPYTLSKEIDELGRELTQTPFLDEMTLSLARAAIENEKLGEDAEPDLLCVGLSALDYVGHGCGPDSQEVADCFLRIDAMLGSFFSHLEKKIGKENLLVALSSDHGVVPLPEWGASQGLPSRRIQKEALRALKDIPAELEKKFGEGSWLLHIDFNGAFVDYDLCRRKKIDPEEIAKEVRRLANAYDFVHEAYLQADVRKPSGGDPIPRLLHNSFYPERSADVLFVAKEWVYVSEFATGTGHGTPWSYDRKVPLLFWGGSIAPMQRSEPVRPADLAPTLAEFLGVSTPKDLSGKSLRQVLSQ